MEIGGTVAVSDAQSVMALKYDVMYGDIAVEVESTALGFRFRSPYDEDWIEIQGDLDHCHIRIEERMRFKHLKPPAEIIALLANPGEKSA